ncbi:AAA family ATPase [Longimicrobium sp.]|uniref:AAA family ATPase n=1 Tax=Longimicrobium sp. TaxID=2029185 RepID=UPI002E317555|nr:AAA family ATPase [Longimicrobium sp.]HEX6036397.1 AAA family ATPase [Longimicrobium sp.]
MRIALSGSHAVGKSTLVHGLGDVLSGYQVVEEPYYALLDEGHSFSAEPTAEDFEIQLERSITSLAGASAERILFDRCPADYLAYLAALPERDPSTLAGWVASAEDVLRRLDLIVYVPVERPDRIEVPEIEGRRLRRRVDGTLREMLVDDAWGVGVPVLEVRGTPEERVRSVLRHLHSAR